MPEIDSTNSGKDLSDKAGLPLFRLLRMVTELCIDSLR